MKYLNLNQKWNIDRVKEPKADSDIKLTADWILNAVAEGYRQGFGKGEARRMFATFQTKLKKVVDAGGYFLEINPIEEIWLKTGFDQCGGNPQTANWIKIAEDAFLSATDKIPEAPKVEVGNAKLEDQVEKTKVEEIK